MDDHILRSLNFGGIGVVIGHEITHGFDDKGRQFDKFGNLIQWWSPNAVEKFKVKAQCIVEQYGNFTLKEVNAKLNGVNTQGENIADYGGLKQAYKTLDKLTRKRRAKITRFKLLTQSTIFINFAQLWCTLMTEGKALSQIRNGVHSPREV
ncbi:18S rRNA pseudouridine methyltransferase [Bulinus truncatus]|nr:18S rRNA pseudouridine methyltransferase [Bulinus truncatus]